MSAVTIYRERLPMHPLLGRHVNLDSRSKAYAVQPTDTPIVSVRHAQSIPVLDQGQVGSCTGNASTSCAYHEPFYAPGAVAWRYTPDETGAQAWYHDNTANDDYPGTWEPDDTGSDGLTSSKMAVAAGVASGYQPALDLDSSLQTLMDRPGITGIPWYPSMFDAPSNGLLTVDMSQPVAGGHELCVDEVKAADAPGNGTGEILVSGPNSWGDGWGFQGRWVMKSSDWWALRQQQGDVYFWTTKSQPAPTPTPVPSPADPADAALWAVGGIFTQEHHALPGYRHLASALETWAQRKGFTNA